MRLRLKRLILLSLQACDGMPMPQGSLLAAVGSLARPDEPTRGDLLEALNEVDAQGFAAGETDDFTLERSWVLTTKGKLKARQL